MGLLGFEYPVYTKWQGLLPGRKTYIRLFEYSQNGLYSPIRTKYVILAYGLLNNTVIRKIHLVHRIMVHGKPFTAK